MSHRLINGNVLKSQISCINTYVYEIWKNGTDEPTRKVGIDTDTEARLVGAAGEEEGGVKGASSPEA